MVPATQPKMSLQAKTHGGFHITLFPETILPADYSILDAMKTFQTTDIPWKMPVNTQPIENNKLYFMYIDEDTTITKLLDHLQKPSGVWYPENRWEPTHLTLGNNTGPEAFIANEIYQLFLKETVWYVQLVERIPKISNPVFKTDYTYLWLEDQRTRLYKV